MSRPATLVLVTLLLTSACGGDGDAPAADPDRLWQEATPFAAFLAAAEARRETWHANYERGAPADELVARARDVPGRWRLLVVAVDRCGDSAHTIPYLARFAEQVAGLELRVVDPEVGRTVMEAHRTPDGRAATPTVLLLDEEGHEAGCWVERPSELQSWWIENPDGLDAEEQLERKYAWYERDAGLSTVREIVERLEGAAAGAPVCDGAGGA